MSIIKFLSENTINKIAAGEVIERPASVLKELIENAIDSNANNIDILLEQAGKNLITVSDNGIGIEPEDLEIALQRHTTSKLNEDDLMNIVTFGFRGEALPSIAAISKISIFSKVKNMPHAWKIVAHGGKILEKKQTLHTEGTKVEVRDLFFATPARLKFLRNEKTELSACISMVKKIALAHPGINFSLRHEGKLIFSCVNSKKNDDFIINIDKNQEKRQNFLNRIEQILGSDFIENTASLNLTRDNISIQGLVSLPTFNRASTSEQFLFVNNRPIKDKILTLALKIAYQDYLAREKNPACVIFITIDTGQVDVNVHPAKTEVRFSEPNLIKNMLISAIKDAITREGHRSSSTIAEKALLMMQKEKQDNIKTDYFNINNNYRTENFSKPKLNYHTETNLVQLKINSQDSYENLDKNNLTQNYEVSEEKQTLYKHEILENRNLAEKIVNNDIIDKKIYIDTENSFLGDAKFQINETYIIAQDNQHLIIVDQHAAHERILYEQIKENLAAQGFIKQRLLLPEIVNFIDEKYIHALIDAKDKLDKFGIEIEQMGSKAVLVRQMPSLVGDVNIGKLITDIAYQLEQQEEETSLSTLIESITETIACHYSLRAGRKLEIAEMNELLKQMQRTKAIAQCNHGRPTYIKLKISDIEKLFGRK